MPDSAAPRDEPAAPIKGVKLMLGGLIGLCLVLAVALAALTLKWRTWQQWTGVWNASPAEIGLQLQALRARAGRADDPQDLVAATLHARLDQAEWLLDQKKTGWSAGGCREMQKQIEELTADLDQRDSGGGLRLGENGSGLCGFWSTLDDTVQTYWVTLPENYDPARRYPLVVSLHGQGLFRPFQGSAYRSEHNLVIAPHGRGGMDYKWVAEPDILAVVAAAQRLFPVDPERIFCAGHSMGGSGAWQLATRYPDLFAAIVPCCGNTDVRVWADLWRWRTPEESPQAEVREFLRHDTGAVDYAENLLNLGVVAFQGEADPIVDRRHGEAMAAALRAAGHPNFKFHFLPLVSHGFSVDTDQALAGFTRQAKPAHVVYRTAWLKYDGAAWARVRGLERRLRFARIEGWADPARNALTVKTENLTALQLDPAATPLSGAVRRIEIDGREAAFTVERPLYFVKTAGGWSQTTPPPQNTFPPQKSRELEGPFEHAFMSRFLLVRPTAQTPTGLAAAAACDGFADLWKQRFGKSPRVLADQEVSDEDIADSHLVVFGGPADNQWAARVADRLPVNFAADQIRLGERSFTGPNLGAKVCYPNPLNPRRYLALVAGLTPESYADINVRFGNWFDWIPYDYRNHFDCAVFDDRTVGRAPETFLTWGFFGEDWSVAKGEWFEGVVTWRDRLRPRVLPGTVPDCAPFWLDQLQPEKVVLDKEYLERNRDLDGRELSLGGRTLTRGLALRFPGTVTFANPVQARFRAVAGIAWDGRTPRSADAERFERAVFSVTGKSGKVLFKSPELRYDSAPLELDVDLAGEEAVTLDVSGGRVWLNGTAIWGDARLE